MAEALRRVLNEGRAAGPGEEGAPGPPLLLLGAPRSAQTSLLFAAALEAAGEGRGPVLFMTRRPLQSLPLNTPAARNPWRLQVTGGPDLERVAQWQERWCMSDRSAGQWRVRRPTGTKWVEEAGSRTGRGSAGLVKSE